MMTLQAPQLQRGWQRRRAGMAVVIRAGAMLRTRTMMTLQGPQLHRWLHILRRQRRLHILRRRLHARRRVPAPRMQEQTL